MGQPITVTMREGSRPEMKRRYAGDQGRRGSMTGPPLLPARHVPHRDMPTLTKDTLLLPALVMLFVTSVGSAAEECTPPVYHFGEINSRTLDANSHEIMRRH